MSPADAVPLHPAAGAHGPLVRFCGYCGLPPEPASASGGRVCAHCGLGLVLAAEASLAPERDEAFSVVDPGLTVRVLSAAAERLFGLVETDVVGQPIDTLVVPAESTAAARPRLRDLLASMARSPVAGAEPETAVVRPARAFGVRYRLRVGPCEPGPAALLVLAPL